MPNLARLCAFISSHLLGSHEHAVYNMQIQSQRYEDNSECVQFNSTLHVSRETYCMFKSLGIVLHHMPDCQFAIQISVCHLVSHALVQKGLHTFQTIQKAQLSNTALRYITPAMWSLHQHIHHTCTLHAHMWTSNLIISLSVRTAWVAHFSPTDGCTSRDPTPRGFRVSAAHSTVRGKITKTLARR